MEQCQYRNVRGEQCSRRGVCPFHGESRKAAKPRHWTKEEHLRFLKALDKYGGGRWKEIAEEVGTRSTAQIQSHGQKHLLRQKSKSSRKRSSIHDITLDETKTTTSSGLRQASNNHPNPNGNRRNVTSPIAMSGRSASANPEDMFVRQPSSDSFTSDYWETSSASSFSSFSEPHSRALTRNNSFGSYTSRSNTNSPTSKTRAFVKSGSFHGHIRAPESPPISNRFKKSSANRQRIKQSISFERGDQTHNTTHTALRHSASHVFDDEPPLIIPTRSESLPSENSDVMDVDAYPRSSHVSPVFGKSKSPDFSDTLAQYSHRAGSRSVSPLAYDLARTHISSPTGSPSEMPTFISAQPQLGNSPLAKPQPAHNSNSDLKALLPSFFGSNSMTLPQPGGVSNSRDT